MELNQSAGEVSASLSQASTLDDDMTMPSHDLMANAIRFLAADGVERAKSGHPGLPMGAADIATVLFTRVMKYDSTDASWPDRDRFILSAGHGSMLLYALLYLTGEPSMSLEEIKSFRQKGSRTPGHPEYGHTSGVETTTGPLGQGLANAVGMALAERMLSAQFPECVDHRTYVLCSDGDLMEGISQEAIAIAGHLRLNRLVVFYDDNEISIDGSTSISDSVDQIKRFESAGWHAERIDGHDPEAIYEAAMRAQKSDKPSLIACRTVIGFGAPNRAGTAKAHGEALGADELNATRAALNWPYEPFDIPTEILEQWRNAGRAGRQELTKWREKLAKLSPDRRAEFERRTKGALPEQLGEAVQAHKRALAASTQAPMATRKASEAVIAVLAPVVPELILGSADLTGSNNNKVTSTPAITPENYAGRFVHWGVREHGMAAAVNGMALHGGFIPSDATFLVFTDYCRPALRLSALMRLRTIHVMTHDSIGLGEDGPTHQPVEHLASLRAIPNMYVYRPADQTETLECWALALQHQHAPSVLALTRQNLSAVRTAYTPENLCAHGAYELSPASNKAAQVSIFASGSEVEIAIEAQKQLETAGLATRVVSVPCLDAFLERPRAEQLAVIGDAPIKVGIEAAIRQGWDPVIGVDGIFIGMSDFGESAPYKQIYTTRGITAENVVAQAMKARG